MTFREQLKIIRDMIDGAFVKDNLDELGVRQDLCEMLLMEVFDLCGLPEVDDGADELCEMLLMEVFDLCGLPEADNGADE